MSVCSCECVQLMNCLMLCFLPHYIHLVTVITSFFADCVLHQSQRSTSLNYLKNAEECRSSDLITGQVDNAITSLPHHYFYLFSWYIKVHFMPDTLRFCLRTSLMVNVHFHKRNILTGYLYFLKHCVYPLRQLVHLKWTIINQRFTH